MHDLIGLALAEDIGSGDLTAQFFIDPNAETTARIFAKEKSTLAGVETAAETFRRVNPTLEVVAVRTDGDGLEPDDTILTIAGKTSSILTAERVALNFVQRLSGIATLTTRYVAAVAGTQVRILDTRKTTPGLRLLEKEAVKAGGGTNHRMGLYDMVMVKDNHLLSDETLATLQTRINRFRTTHPDKRVELEADRPDQVKRFLTLTGVDVILLDNMSLDQLRECVEMPHHGVKFEASGGVNLDSVSEIARTGVDYISVGALTHSARAIDFSLELT